MSGEGYEESLIRRHEEMAVLIGHALRRAAGLPEEDDPFVIINPDCKSLPKLRLVASKIIVASHGKQAIAKTPKAIAKNLKDIRRKLGYLRAQITAMDGYTSSSINRAGSTYLGEYREAEDEGDFDRAITAFIAAGKVPRDQWIVPAALAAMKHMEDALVPVIETAVQNSQSTATGRPPDMAKSDVALIVWRYIRDVTEEDPKLWPDDAPPEPWKRGESNEPFAVALREIFRLLGFKPGINAAGEFATSKL